MNVRFFVPSLPVAQPRQRQRAFVAGSGRVCVSNYTPAKHPVNAFKAAVQQAASKHLESPSDRPVSLVLRFAMKRPQSMVWKTRAMPREKHVSKPDGDNLAKAVLDALTGIAWRDDSQVWHCLTVKEYAAGEEMPGVDIEMMFG